MRTWCIHGSTMGEKRKVSRMNESQFVPMRVLCVQDINPIFEDLGAAWRDSPPDPEL